MFLWLVGNDGLIYIICNIFFFLGWIIKRGGVMIKFVECELLVLVIYDWIKKILLVEELIIGKEVCLFFCG